MHSTEPCKKISKLENICTMNNSVEIYWIHSLYTEQVFVDCRCCILFILLVHISYRLIWWKLKFNQITKKLQNVDCWSREKSIFFFSTHLIRSRKGIYFLCVPCLRIQKQCMMGLNKIHKNQRKKTRYLVHDLHFKW